jgi:hypothetical protein
MRKLIMLLLLASCKGDPETVTVAKFDNLRRSIATQIDSQVTTTVKRIVPDFIGRAVLTNMQILMIADSVNKANIVQLSQVNAAIYLTNKQLTEKLTTIEITLSKQLALNTKLIADTAAKGTRILTLEKNLISFRSKIDTLTLIPDTTKDFIIKGRVLGLRK